MTEAEELELLELEIGIRQKMQEQITDPARAKKGLPTGTLRDVAAGALTGPSKVLGSVIDLLESAGPRRTEGSRVSVGPAVQGLQESIAGRPTAGSVPAAMAEGATGSLMFPGGPLANMLAGGLSSGTTQSLLNAGVSPGKAALGGMAVGGPVGLATAVPGAFGKAHAKWRVNRALRGSSEDDLAEAIRMQRGAADRDMFLFPSQAFPTEAPGLQQLETDILRSWSKEAVPAQQLGFKQAPMSSWAAKRTTQELLPPAAGASPEQTAEALRLAAQKRLAAGPASVNERTAGLYKTAGASQATVGGEDLTSVFKIIQDATKAPQTAGEAKVVLRRLGNQLMKESSQYKGAIPAPRMYTIYQDFEKELAKVTPGGVPAYSDNAAGQVRNVLNASLRDYLEKAEPHYALARELQKSGKGALEGAATPQLEQLAGGGGEARNYLSKALEKGQGLAAIAGGQPAKSGRLGANPEAVRDALALSMQQQREGAFRLSGAGEMLQGSPSIFVRSLVGTPEKKQALTMALRSVGIPDERVGKFMEDLKILGATGRPTVVHGTRVPGTEINPIDIARATFGGALQQQQARMTLLRSAVNLISDAEIARIMAQPESLKLLQKMPGWKALDPRAALAAVIASQWQANEGK